MPFYFSSCSFPLEQLAMFNAAYAADFASLSLCNRSTSLSKRKSESNLKPMLHITAAQQLAILHQADC
jgi:hypothetical protein